MNDRQYVDASQANKLNSTPTRSTLLTTADGEPTLGELVMGLTDDISTLVRKEVDLAKAELQESVKEGAQAGGMIAAGGMVAYAGLLLILAALAVALGDWWDNYWLGAAVVGLVTGIIGWAVLNGGLKQLKEVSLVPRKTIDSLERDAKMAKEKLS
jgi:hypothetical protein